jgi:S-adenosylmethionine:diacylglycerol 3-amino-3-carboxypropyl transferase
LKGKKVFENLIVKVYPDGRVSRRDAAIFLGLAPKTLANWSSTSRGPRPHRVGNRVFYRLGDLQAFVVTGANEAASR